MKAAGLNNLASFKETIKEWNKCTSVDDISWTKLSIIPKYEVTETFLFRAYNARMHAHDRLGFHHKEKQYLPPNM